MKIGRGVFAVLATALLTFGLANVIKALPGLGQSKPSTLSTWEQSVSRFELARKYMREAENAHFWTLFKPMQKLSNAEIGRLAEEPCAPVRDELLSMPAGYTKPLQEFLKNKGVKQFILDVDARTGEFAVSMMPVVKFDTPAEVPHKSVSVVELKKLNPAYVGLMLVVEHKDHSLIQAFRSNGAELHLALPVPKFEEGTPAEKIAELTDIWKNPGFARYFQYDPKKNTAPYQPVQLRFETRIESKDPSRISY